MKFEVYCDESSPDVFTSRSERRVRFLMIGSLWLPAELRQDLKNEIATLKDSHRVGGQIKWQKVSPSRQSFYTELTELFVQHGDDLRFRCIAVDKDKLDFKLYHEEDRELGFYKFYYQMLHHWILDFNDYQIFCDIKTNAKSDRLHDLQKCLQNANLSASISSVQAVPSSESALVQFADFLLGATNARMNDLLREGSTKKAVVEHLESLLNRPRLTATGRQEHKFNVFEIEPGKGGW